MTTNVLAEDFFADKKRLLDSVRYEENPKGIITVVKLDDGEFHVISHYEDSVWRLPHHWFPSNAKNSEKGINFELVDNPTLRAAAKLVMARQLWGTESEGKRKAGFTYFYAFFHLAAYLNWLSMNHVTSLVGITPLLNQRYVEYVKSQRSVRGKNIGKTLTIGSQFHRLVAVERCWHLTRDTIYAFEHPWPESSAVALLGYRKHKAPQTHIIPDNILEPLAQWAEKTLNTADILLAHRDSLAAMTFINRSRSGQTIEENVLLTQLGWLKGVRQFEKALTELRDSALVLIFLTTGMRRHEVLNIRRGCWYSTVKDNERYYFIGSRSDKTYEGNTHWLCPKIAIDAVQVLEQLSAPPQKLLEQELQKAGAAKQYNELMRLEGVSGCVALVAASTKKNQLFVLSGDGLRYMLQSRINLLNLDWHLTPHQFRRTFANFVVHHKLGDLRYLRDHFKHWSLDMPALYAMNEAQDLELYDEIYSAFDSVKQGIIGHWLEPDTPLSGGLAPQIRNLREKGESVRTYSSRKEMIKAISDQIFLRSTSIAWCTNDDGGCGGGQCESCEHGVIDDKKLAWWEAVYVQQIELRLLNDMGEGENRTVERAIIRCEKVLSDLGADMEAIKKRVTPHV